MLVLLAQTKLERCAASGLTHTVAEQITFEDILYGESRLKYRKGRVDDSAAHGYARPLQSVAEGRGSAISWKKHASWRRGPAPR